MRRSWIYVSALLGGCTSYQPKPIDLERHAHSFELRTLASEQLHQCLRTQPALNIPAWPIVRWDRRTLSAAAVCYSPALELARLRRESAKADAFAAGARVNPALQFPFEFATNRRDGISPYTTGPIFDIPVGTADKRGHKIRQAALSAQAAAWNFTSEEWKLRSHLREALLVIYASEQRVQIGSLTVALQQQVIDIMRRRDSVGETARPEVQHSELRLTQTQSDLALADQALLEARTRLAAIIGVPPGALDKVQFDLAEFEHPALHQLPDAARRTAVLGRPDLLAALSEYEVSQASLQLEVARQYPDVHISAGYTYDAGANKISLGLASLTLPLLDRNQGPIAQAEARRSEAAARVVALQDAIINDVAQAHAGYLASSQATALSSLSLATAMRQLKSQSASFSAGMSDRLEFTQAQIDYQTAVADHLRALIAMQQWIGVMENALQESFPAEGASRPTPEYVK